MRTKGPFVPVEVVLAVLLLADSLLAGSAAMLTGRVTDTSGAVIVGANVTATNVNTNVSFFGETNPEGLYNIPDLPPGSYRVMVQKAAFQTVVQPDVELHVAQLMSLNFSLVIGSVTESITVEDSPPLIQTASQRGGNFTSREVTDLPLVGLNPISLARTLPGVTELPGSSLYSTGSPSVNGQRFRSNNYLLDGTENNDAVFTGIAQPFNIADAVEEVSLQTGNFGVEFGRTGGGIFNLVTKSGSNSFHGTLLWRYQSQRFNSVSNLAKLQRTPQSVFSRNVYGFTVGGPIHEDKTFFFGGFQKDTLRSTKNFPLVVPTEATVGRLRSLFPSNPRLDLYLGFLGGLRGIGTATNLQLGVDPQTGLDRGVVQFASAPLALPNSEGGTQWLGKLDHHLSVDHRMTFRYVADSRTTSPLSVGVLFPGFISDQSGQDHNFLFTDRYTFSPTSTNEFRFSYARQEYEQARISSRSIADAQTLPRINIASVASPGVNSQSLQFAKVNNLTFQDTHTKLTGRHTFRFGVEFFKQLATQRPAAFSAGDVTYNDATAAGYSAFANFLDDFSGLSGRWRKDFQATIFHPDQFRHSYFFQDTWLPAPALSLTLGLRYENFGQVANTLPYPAFAGFDPVKFLEPNRVNADNNNFGPAFGLAWSPHSGSGWLSKLLGEDKTVLRGGFQISYEPFFTQMLSLLLAASSPNGISADVFAPPTTSRGAPNWFTQVPIGGSVATPLDNQAGVLDKDLRTPYTERWSFGFQHQLSNRILLDGSYVGTVGHKLTTWSDANPQQLTGQRIHPDFGPRRVRTSEGNSSYHAMQWRVERRFSRGLEANASYTWSKFIDSTSEGVGAVVTQGNQSNLTSVPVTQGGLKLDRGLSDYDRPHRLTVLFLWNVPGLRSSIGRYVLGGWSIAGIATLQSGAPYTITNGLDRNNDGWTNDRPDIGDLNAPLNTRAVMANSCPTLYRNPDSGACVDPQTVHWVQRTGLPNGFTVGRNTLRAGGTNNLDLMLSKSFQIRDGKRLEFRWEALNALNHPQFTGIPARSVAAPASQQGSPSQFLNRDFTDSGIRSMWVQVKFLF